MQPKQQERRDSTVSDLDSRVPSCFLTLLSVDHIQPVISTTHGISVPNICFSGDITHIFTQLYSLNTCITSWQLAIYDPQPQVLNCKFSFSEKVSHITKLSIFAGIVWLYAFSLLTHSNSKRHKKLPFFFFFSHRRAYKIGVMWRKGTETLDKLGYPCILVSNSNLVNLTWENIKWTVFLSG